MAVNTNLQIRLVLNATNNSQNVRIAKDPRNNQLYFLKINGDIYQVNLHDSTTTKVYGAADHGLSSSVEGLAIGPDGTVYVLEIAGRPIGGLCATVLRLVRIAAVGRRALCSLEEVLLRHAIGESTDEWTREADGAAVMMIPIPARGILKGVIGADAARRVHGVTDVRITARIGQLLEPLPEAGSYLGFIFARGASAADAERAVREAHRKLTFEVAREITVNR